MLQSGLRSGAVRSVPKSATREPATTLVCFSHLRWAFVYQRPQHLLTRAARHYRVIFFEEPVHEAVVAPRLDQTEREGGVTVAVPVLPHGLSPAEAEAMQGSLLDELLAAEQRGRLIFWYYTPMALGFSADHRPDLCIYDCMDELSAFRFAPPQLMQREGDLFQRCDLVFTGGHSLYEAKRGRHPDVHAFPSSIDAAHFGKARHMAGPEPADQAEIPHPRLGFFGVIDERMDVGLLAELAELRPDWHFVMIGPVVKIEEGSLPRPSNIHWLGGKTYGELPSYIAGWDVALMPFAMNESTRYISPTKTPEYLAAGAPVISTPVVDVVRGYGRTGLVEIAATAQEFAQKGDELLRRPKEQWLREVDRHLAGLSWDRTWDEMHALIRSKLGSGQLPGRTAAAPTTEAAHV
jgi:glycosyltransferase involved in cell wall biosynthesis